MKTLLLNFLKLTLALAIVILLDFKFGEIYYPYLDRLFNFYGPIVNRLNPCSQPINYSLDKFDKRFNITEKEFLNNLKLAEQIWEKPTGKNLIDYKVDGALKINLIYDYRQEATDKLRKLGIVIDSTQESYNKIKANYNALMKKYELQKSAFEKIVSDYNTKSSAYSAEVAYLNKIGSISKERRAKVEADRIVINNIGTDIKKRQAEMQSLVDDINATVGVLNRLAGDLNLNAGTYNTIGATRGKEFQEGEYVRDKNGEKINIYQFDNKNKLVRVLAHELGHALGLEHNNNPESIMYKLNESKNEKLSAEDIEDVRMICGIK